MYFWHFQHHPSVTFLYTYVWCQLSFQHLIFACVLSLSFDELDCICGVLFLLFVKAKRNILRLLFRVSSCLDRITAFVRAFSVSETRLMSTSTCCFLASFVYFILQVFSYDPRESELTADLSLSLFTSISTSVIGFPVAFTDHILQRNVFLYFFVLKRFMLFIVICISFCCLSWEATCHGRICVTKCFI